MDFVARPAKSHIRDRNNALRRIKINNRQECNRPDRSSLPSCSIAVKAGAPREGVAAEERPALTAICARRPRQYGRSGREKACGAVEQEKGGQEERKEKGAGGLDLPGAHISGHLHRTAGLPLHIRVGVNSGEVVVRSIGSDLHMDYTAVGQTTHLAARLEQMAMPGSILISPETLKLAEGYVLVKALGRRPIKGLEAQIEV